ncbi:protein kinase [Streptomyces sp. NA04227]|uniref:serine/threonine protein kinase n=1 Tax=Streptomyces sp. NA04227 TaxID=2742136 RepID=UPI001591A9AB|nr:serine/threonine-protein kinase [Streptomyces sp. NA04227]QKW06339.1 protein kinase [Streptomyces sp. NA04227]
MSSAPSAEHFQPLQEDDPAVVGGYRLAAVLGAGGMGKVYLTYTPGGRPIALKVIRPEFSEDPEFRRRFQQEVQAAQRVQGLYTAPVIDCDTEGSQPWLATAYVPGPSLAHAVAAHGALPVRSVLLLTVGVAEALSVIHGAGIVHRDLKPANVLLASDGPRVIDFGIARAADATALTGNGVTVGTPSFMAPEQAATGTVTPATDIFALGQIAAYAAIGAPAYGDGPSHAVLYRIVHEEPDLSRLPEELRPLVTRCLSRDPADRPALNEVIELCQSLSPTPLRQGEDWLPRAVAGSITERLQLPAPAKTPPPMPGAAPTPTEYSPPPTQGTPAGPYAPTGPQAPAAPGGFGPAAAPTQGAQPAPGSVPPPGFHTPAPTPAPGYHTPPPGGGGYQPTPLPSGGGPRPWGAPPPPRKKKSGLIAVAAIVGVLVVLGVIGALVPDDEKDKSESNAGPSSSSSQGSGSSAGAGSSDGGTGDDSGGKRPDPKPVSYTGVDLVDGYYLMFADNPRSPIEGSGGGVMYDGGDFYYDGDSSSLSESEVGSNNGKLVLLNNSQQGSLETCRAETRYTEEISLDQLSDGSQMCVLSDAGHVAVVTYRGKSGASDPSDYVKLDLTLWRNAEEPKETE